MNDTDLDFRNRDALFQELDGKRFDLVVVGAGITGAGIARDAASRGLSVVLVEARDIAAGTSSRSSKMIHGGLRYLEQGEVGLVRESATERTVLRRIAPHLARPGTFVIPATSRTTLAKINLGLWGFDRLGEVPPHERHQRWSKGQLMEQEPLAAVDGAVGAVAYPEYLTNDARLTLANVRSASAHGARVITYAPVTEIICEGDRAIGVVVEGGLPGERQRATLFGRRIVNAAGPWVDALRAVEDRSERPRLTLTKGVHVVLPRERLPLQNTVLMIAEDGRPVFAVPSGAVTYLGTTDTFYEKTDYWPGVEQVDVDYIFRTAERSLRISGLHSDEIVAVWSGLRPLISRGAKRPSEISRRDELWVGSRGVLSIAGGKLSAYRKMAERVVDRVVGELDRQSGPTITAREPLVGGDLDYEQTVSDLASVVAPANARRLVDLYGAEARIVVREGADISAEVRHAVCREGALTLEDYWVRRSARAWFDIDAGAASLEPAALEMARLLGWSDEVRKQQTSHCRERHADSFAHIQRPRPISRSA